MHQLVCAGLSGKGVVGIGVWGKGYGGKHAIVEGIRTDDRKLTGLLEDLLVVIVSHKLNQPVSPEERLH